MTDDDLTGNPIGNDTTGQPEDEARNARLEWLLHERVGNESPPDLRHAVLEKLREADEQPRQRTPSRWLAAAAVAIGIGAVIAVAMQSGDHSSEPGANEAQDPAYVAVVWKDPALVRSRQDIDKLPADTRQVFGVNLKDDDLPALLRLKQLEGLAMTTSTFEDKKNPFPRGGQKKAPVYLTDAGLEHLAAHPGLRALVLEGQIRIQGPGLAKLVHNSRLRELKMQSMAVTTDMLRGISSAPLEHLMLDYSQTFGADGLAAVAACSTLRRVSLRGCTHLDDTAIAKLAGMKNLEVLILGTIGSHTIFTGLRLSPLPEESPGSGVTDRLLDMLHPLPKLRELDLGAGDIHDRGLASLRKFPALRELDLGSVGTITAAGITSLPDSIEQVSLLGHRELDEGMLTALFAKKNLTDVNIAWCRGLPANAVDLVCNAGHLRKVNVSGWQLDDDDRQRLAALPFEVKMSKPKKK